jgi:hypothetical protein
LLTAYGDLKQALINLQVIMNTPDTLLVDKFYHIFGIPHLPLIREMIKDASSVGSSKAYTILTQLLDQGHQATDILDIIFKVIVINEPMIGTSSLTRGQQIMFLNATSQCLYKTELTGGSNHHLFALLADFCTVTG